MSISRQGIPAPGNAAVGTSTYAEILKEYPELADDVARLTSQHDVGNYDRRSKSFERRFPELRPTVDSSG